MNVKIMSQHFFVTASDCATCASGPLNGLGIGGNILEFPPLPHKSKNKKA